MIPVYFEKENHIYYADANRTVQIPSLSHILSDIGIDSGLDNVPQSIRETARQRGSAVHLTLELFDKDNLADALIWQPYLDSWIEVMKLFGIKKWDYIEHSFRSEKYGYAFTLDRAYKGKIVEIKTGESEYPKYKLQTALQDIGLSENEGRKVPSGDRIAVHFDKKGRYKIKTHDDHKDYLDAVTCVEFYHVKKSRIK